jgi:hypothetical protein
MSVMNDQKIGQLSSIVSAIFRSMRRASYKTDGMVNQLASSAFGL